jgi:cytochrome c oxidase subunit 2
MFGAPALASGLLSAWALFSLAAGPSTAASQEPEPRTISIVARRYAFEPAEIEVVAGERVRLVIRSGDGLHGFAIRRFRIQEEIRRGGDPVTVEFTADEPGRFPILCSEYCGEGHDDMNGTLVVTARTASRR